MLPFCCPFALIVELSFVDYSQMHYRDQQEFVFGSNRYCRACIDTKDFSSLVYPILYAKMYATNDYSFRI